METAPDVPNGMPLPGQSFDQNQAKDVAESARSTRELLNRLIEILNQFEPLEMLDGLGRRLTVLAIQDSGGELGETLGFVVYRSSPEKVGVTPSFVSGASVIAKMPQLGGTDLDDETTPELPVPQSIVKYFALKLEIVPESTLDLDGVTYMIRAGAGLLTGEITVEMYGSIADMEADSQIATVDPSDGAVIDNGIFVIPIGKQNSDDSITNLGYYYGPLGIQLCASGVLEIQGPAVVQGTVAA